MTRLPLGCRLFGHDWHVRILVDAPITCRRCGMRCGFPEMAVTTGTDKAQS